jgi:uracil-DNA glycosylase family 4
MNQEPRNLQDSEHRLMSSKTISKKLYQSLTIGIDYDLDQSESFNSLNLDPQEHSGVTQTDSTTQNKHSQSSWIDKTPSNVQRVNNPTKQDSMLDSTDNHRIPVSPPIRLIDQIRALNSQVQECQLCGLCLTRTNPVPGMGSYEPLVMVIGEGPGAEEDRQGLPFVGKAGQYLDEWLKALGLSRQETVYITNIVKCRPPANRDPHPEEIKSCGPYLEKQIELLKPRVILSLGRVSAGFLLGGAHRMEDIHGKMFEYRGVPVIPTYHPSAVLRNQDLRRPVWEDLKQMHQFLYVQGLVSELPQRKKE